MYTGNLAALVGKDVEVTANGGMLYRGRLIEISEHEVFIQAELGWIQIAVENVTDIRPKG